MLLGVFLAAFQLCFAAGIALTDASTAALFQCVEPTTAALLGALLRLERLTTAKALSALLAGGGILLMELDPSRAHTNTNTTNGSEANGMQRVIGCTLLFGQGIGIACFCLLQRQLLRLTAPPTLSSGEQRLLDGASPSSSVGDDGCESAAASNGNSGGGAPITTSQPLILANFVSLKWLLLGRCRDTLVSTASWRVARKKLRRRIIVLWDIYIYI